MDCTENKLLIAYLNCRGQNGLNESKQLQIQQFLQVINIDILHLQETNIEEETFTQCRFIISNYSLIHNNSPSKYGTASLIRSTFQVDNIILHHSGRIIVLNIGDLTLGNVFLLELMVSAGQVENLCAEVIPTLLINSKVDGMIGGDWNNIICKKDCTRHPEGKMSPSLKRVANTFSWKDSFRSLHPDSISFSRYYANERHGEGATRIDRSYIFGELTPVSAMYTSVAFSDHLSYIVTVQLPSPLQKAFCPKSRPFFKTRPAVVNDKLFQARLACSMKESKTVWSTNSDLVGSSCQAWD